MITPNWYVCSAFVMFYPSTTNHHSMFPWFSPLSDRSPWQTHTTNLKSFGRPPWHKYQFVGCKSRRNSFIGHPKVRANFIRMSTVGWKWVSAARLVCFGGVRIVCIYKSYIDIYKYNLQFCCIWWLLLCSCYFFFWLQLLFLLLLMLIPHQISGPTPPTKVHSDHLQASKGQGFWDDSLLPLLDGRGLWIERFMPWAKDTKTKIKHGVPRNKMWVMLNLHAHWNDIVITLCLQQPMVPWPNNLKYECN